MLNTKEGAHRNENSGDKLSTLVIEDVRWDIVRDVPLIEEDVCIERVSSLGRWDSLSQFGILIGNDKNVLVPCVVLGKGSTISISIKVEWFRLWKEQQFTPTAIFRVVSHAA